MKTQEKPIFATATFKMAISLYWKKHPGSKKQYYLINDRIKRVEFLKKISGMYFPLCELVDFVDEEI